VSLRRKSIKSSTRSIALMRKHGWMVGSVEKYVAAIKRHIDLFNFIDVLAVLGNRTVAIQSCVGNGDVAKHLAKFRDPKLAPKVRAWLQGGTRELVIQSWAERGDRGKRKTWTCVTHNVTLQSLNFSQTKKVVV
jgi:transglutaminase-like putative cysteine protease